MAPFKTLEQITTHNIALCVMNRVSSFNSESERATILKSEREKLNEYLIGPVHSRVRELLLKKYGEITLQQGLLVNWQQFDLFLGIILDDSFTKLSSAGATVEIQGGPHSVDALDIVNTIVTCCPNLVDLSLRSSCPFLLTSGALLVSSLSSLKNLTVLNISYCQPSQTSDATKFFMQIGTSCPKLVELTLENWPFLKEQALALVLGPLADLLPEEAKQLMWGTGHNMHLYQFPTHHLTPICQTLKCLHMSSLDPPKGFKIKEYPQTVAFILRHLSRLEKIEVVPLRSREPSPFFDAVLLLYGDPTITRKPVGEQQNWQVDVFKTNGNGRQLISWKVNSPPPSMNFLSFHYVTVFLHFIFYF